MARSDDLVRPDLELLVAHMATGAFGHRSGVSIAVDLRTVVAYALRLEATLVAMRQRLEQAEDTAGELAELARFLEEAT